MVEPLTVIAIGTAIAGLAGSFLGGKAADKKASEQRAVQREIKFLNLEAFEDTVQQQEATQRRAGMGLEASLARRGLTRSTIALSARKQFGRDLEFAQRDLARRERSIMLTGASSAIEGEFQSAIADAVKIREGIALLGLATGLAGEELGIFSTATKES